MKIFSLVTIIGAVYGQKYNGNDNGNGNNKLMNNIEKAVSKCMVYMEKALTCEPPQGKISKYTHRLSAVLLDAAHHESIGKCDPKAAYGGNGSYRRRREDDGEIDAEFDALMAG